jgi:hypothetical protein
MEELKTFETKPFTFLQPVWGCFPPPKHISRRTMVAAYVAGVRLSWLPPWFSLKYVWGGNNLTPAEGTNKALFRMVLIIPSWSCIVHSTIPDPETLMEPSRDRSLSNESVMLETKSFIQGVTDQEAPVSMTMGTSWSGHGCWGDRLVLSFGWLADKAKGGGGAEQYRTATRFS